MTPGDMDVALVAAAYLGCGALFQWHVERTAGVVHDAGWKFWLTVVLWAPLAAFYVGCFFAAAYVVLKRRRGP